MSNILSRFSDFVALDAIRLSGFNLLIVLLVALLLVVLVAGAFSYRGHHHD